MHLQTELYPSFHQNSGSCFYLLKITHAHTVSFTQSLAEQCLVSKRRSVGNRQRQSSSGNSIQRGHCVSQLSLLGAFPLLRKRWQRNERVPTRWKAHYFTFFARSSLSVLQEYGLTGAAHPLVTSCQLSPSSRNGKNSRALGLNWLKGKETQNGHKWKVFRFKTSLEGETIQESV